MAQIKKKFIANNAIDETKIRLSNNEFLRSRDFANSVDVDLFKINASDKIEFSSIPQASGTASSADDLVNKSSSDAAIASAVSASVADSISDGVTNVAPSQNAVFDALALKVATSRTVNGHALTADVTVTKSDVGLGSVDNVQQLPMSYLDTDNTLASDSDAKVPSQKAIKAYVDGHSGSASVALDGTFRIENTSDTSKKIAFDASGISASSVRSLKMPDANVDLGNLANSNISSSAAIAMSKLAALTANKVLLSDGSGFISASSVSNTTLGYLDATSSIQTQLDSKLNLSGSNGPMTGTLDMGANKITSSYVPDSANVLVNKAYADQLAITGGTVKEAVLVSEQFVNGGSGGISAAEIFHFTHMGANAVDGDFLVLKNASTTETYTFRDTPLLTFDVQIGANEEVTENNLVSKINTESVDWTAKDVESGLNFSDQSVVVIMDKVPTSTSTSRIYGTFASPTTVFSVPFNGTVQYSTAQPDVQLPSSDPGSVRFGFGRAFADMVDGEQHVCLELNEIHSWNSSSSVWFMLSGGGSVPNATAASGGGVLGKISGDSDKGIAIASGVLSVKVDNSTIDFSSGNLEVKSGGISNTQVSASAGIVYSKLSIADGDLTIAKTSGLQTALDGKQSTTLADGKILIGNVSNVATAQTMSGDVSISNAGVTAIGSGKVTNDMIVASAGIPYSKLTIADGDLSIAKTSGLQSALDAKELLANKSTDVTLGGLTPSDTLYSSQAAVKSYVDTEIAAQEHHRLDQKITLNGTDISNQYVDLLHAAISANAISLFPVGGLMQEPAVDFTVSLTGGVAGVTRITFAADLATGGAAELVSGDKLVISYDYQ